MILVIDIGNSNITFGIFDGDELVKRFRAPSNFCAPMDEYLALIKENLGETTSVSNPKVLSSANLNL